MSDDDDGAWFGPLPRHPRSNRPIAWQGWAVCIGYGLLITGAALLASTSWVASTAIIVAATVAFFWAIARKTRSG